MQRSKSRSKENSAAREVRITAVLRRCAHKYARSLLAVGESSRSTSRCRVHVAVASPAYPETRRMNYVHDQVYPRHDDAPSQAKRSWMLEDESCARSA